MTAYGREPDPAHLARIDDDVLPYNEDLNFDLEARSIPWFCVRLAARIGVTRVLGVDSMRSGPGQAKCGLGV